jgi:hypothetical protein
LANVPRPAHFTEDKEAMTQREHEKLELAFWIGVISVELGLFTWLTQGRRHVGEMASLSTSRVKNLSLSRTAKHETIPA